MGLVAVGAWSWATSSTVAPLAAALGALVLLAVGPRSRP